MMRMYLNTDFVLFEQREEKMMLHVEIEENKDSVIMRFATLCSFFEKKLYQMGQKEYPNKNIRIVFRSDIPLDYYSFRAFKKAIFS